MAPERKLAIDISIYLINENLLRCISLCSSIQTLHAFAAAAHGKVSRVGNAFAALRAPSSSQHFKGWLCSWWGWKISFPSSTVRAAPGSQVQPLSLTLLLGATASCSMEGLVIVGWLVSELQRAQAHACVHKRQPPASLEREAPLPP
eukprot:363200-Chlamydomonas_euryale.AAC.5